jgi:hypothetical protein
MNSVWRWAFALLVLIGQVVQGAQSADRRSVIGGTPGDGVDLVC